MISVNFLDEDTGEVILEKKLFQVPELNSQIFINKMQYRISIIQYHFNTDIEIASEDEVYIYLTN